MANDALEDLRGHYEYDTNNWAEIRKEAKIDMAFVGGNPWTSDDEKQRKDRPSIAPEELSQYRNQVLNALMTSPRGMKFSPVGNGANDKGAEFYQNKAREIEYRSHASQQYLLAADNALQRGYGFVRVNVKYAQERSVNQDLYIEGFPNPDMVLPDSDALRPDSADMKRCFVKLWMPRATFKRDYKNAKIKNFDGLVTASNKDWLQGDRVQVAEYWEVKTRQRKLVLVQLAPPTPPSRQLAPVPQAPAVPPLQVFEDELAAFRARMPGLEVLRELRAVDYPEVWMYLTNGIEILHQQQWLGKYIPIVSCYGKVLFVEGDQGMERKILSLTRFGRDPWKAYCYCCSQQLEIIGQVPRTSVVADPRQLKGFEADWKEAPYVPKAVLHYHASIADLPGVTLPPPTRAPYMQGENLQALEMVKEGFRRAIQAAMGSNFLPTQAQRRNEKSGVALDKIEQAAARGTYHFVNSYEDMIRQAGVISEDLMDKIYDYQGDVSVMEAEGKAAQVRINDANSKDAVSTKGDYLVTVSTAPSSDSERDAASDFTDTLIGQLERIAQVSGPKAAAALLARAIRMRNLGVQGDLLADIIEPPEYRAKDGQPPSPELMSAQQQIQQLTGLLKQAAQEKQAKVVEQDGKFKIEQMKAQAGLQESAADNETKLAVAELSAKFDRMQLFMEERARLGVQDHEAAMGHADAEHEMRMARLGQQHALEAGQQTAEQQASASEQGHQQALEQQQAAAAAQPEV